MGRGIVQRGGGISREAAERAVYLFLSLGRRAPRSAPFSCFLRHTMTRKHILATSLGVIHDGERERKGLFCPLISLSKEHKESLDCGCSLTTHLPFPWGDSTQSSPVSVWVAQRKILRPRDPTAGGNKGEAAHAARPARPSPPSSSLRAPR